MSTKQLNTSSAADGITLCPNNTTSELPKALERAIESVLRDPDPTLSHYDFSDHTNHN